MVAVSTGRSLRLAGLTKASRSIGLVTPRYSQPPISQGLASKAHEIEELADAYFFRPLGSIIARGGHALGMTPIHLTVAGTLAGLTGGVMLYDQRFGVCAFALLILYGTSRRDGRSRARPGRFGAGPRLDGAQDMSTTCNYLAIAASVLIVGK